ncbi:TetR/AcrR family transcriptional regulator C-terminal domain-containing protein [Amycolatopsis azurea]|uniref:TetR family transcriptional regulator n=1 Tax=Amycolatopsis azurea DSM 43854 TaxID=1238180 RepID=M2Q6D6_9PSEU|nr:TetR/AcrR family transcriptional regulator C-terminal domain-containing protein [Amycolatopsis azurea]EMD21687.1 Transcriptional regulator, TetR family [Amycolatopsis azurea DSM 43854]OOC05484.1 TetR family transcriptional regulator [Amycolatopsis azurea DSM 43854]
MGLTRQDIVRAGLRLLNDVGLNGLTLRLIAQELDVKAPALYWHVKNKQELLDEMATQMYADAMPGRVPEGLGERETLEVASRGMRRMMLAYRDGAKVFSGTFMTDDDLLGDNPLQGRVDAGLEPYLAGRALFTVYSYVVGFTIEEQAVYPVPGERDPRYDILPTAWVFDEDVEGRFGDGLTMVLDGVFAWLDDKVLP